MIKKSICSRICCLVLLLILLLISVRKLYPTQRSINVFRKETDRKITYMSSTVSTPANEKPKLILYWRPDGSSGEETSVGECEVTYDKNRLKEAGMVAFHYTTISGNDIPWKHYRDPKQIFVFWNAEPASLWGKGGLTEFDNFFNWTWTYKRTADALRGYGTRGRVLAAVKRGKLVMWTVSNCGKFKGATKRMQYYKDLVQAGLTVSTFGKCFAGSEKITWSFPTNYPDRLKRHKFYLAFENSVRCRDYITEKFWDNALKNDMVPVVWGPAKEDVLAVAPIDSFIHCDDFESPAKLAEYLHFLDQNDDEYRKYFRWREDESMSEVGMAKLTKEKYPDIDVQFKSKDLCEEYLKNTNTKIIKSLNQEFLRSDRD
uniref:Fucosyltransferase n=1 Tax=Ciona savignyi TaxID=51511 RepID=H2ZF44_CIOSA